MIPSILAAALRCSWMIGVQHGRFSPYRHAFFCLRTTFYPTGTAVAVGRSRGARIIACDMLCGRVDSALRVVAFRRSTILFGRHFWILIRFDAVVDRARCLSCGLKHTSR